ncbi:MAG: AAA family ATPase [Planctomycetes bacterium]|nr:AAA family ATPase [Planctomycetota bacterium]
MIKRLSVQGYKSLLDVELTDLGRTVVLFGPNAAGKSNLLDALDLLSHLAREDTLTAAFQKHRGNRLGRPLPVRWFFSGGNEGEPRELTMRFRIDFDLQDRIVDEINDELKRREAGERLARPYTRVSRRSLRYELTISYDAAARTLDVTSESLKAINRDGEERNEVPFIKHEDEGRLSVKLERQSHPRHFPVPRQRTILSEVGDLVNHPHLVAAARELASIRVFYVEPTRMRGEVSDLRATDPGSFGESLASFYHWLAREHPIKHRNLVDNLTRLVPGLRGLEVKEGSEGFLELWVDERDRGHFHAAMVSEGTLRILCLLGIAATPRPPAVVGYEEPENGVNPARLRDVHSIIEEAASRPGGSQFFLTTHSSEVLSLFGEAVAFTVKRGLGGSEYRRSPVLPVFAREQVDGTLGPSLGERVTRGDLG